MYYRPLRTFNFAIFFGSQTTAVALMNKMSALKRKTDVVTIKEGGSWDVVKKIPGKTEYSPVTFEQGLIYTERATDKLFYEWASHGGVRLQVPSNLRHDLRVEVNDLDGTKIFEYWLYNCWVSEFTAVSELDANANTVGIRSFTVENEGWERKK